MGLSFRASSQQGTRTLDHITNPFPTRLYETTLQTTFLGDYIIYNHITIQLPKVELIELLPNTAGKKELYGSNTCCFYVLYNLPPKVSNVDVYHILHSVVGINVDFSYFPHVIIQ